MRAVLLVLFCATLLSAADFNGKWSHTVGTSAGPQTVVYTFKTEGGVVKASRALPAREQYFENVKVSGDEISFRLDLTMPQTPDNKIIMLYKGKLSGEEIQFTEQRETMPDGSPGSVRKFTLKRVQ